MRLLPQAVRTISEVLDLAFALVLGFSVKLLECYR